MDKNLIAEAKAYMEKFGNVEGIHFTEADVVAKANQHAFDMECRNRENVTHFPIEFDGQNCDDCEGWIPGNRRCECGNRRVAWMECFSHTFKNPCVYAEAW